MVKAEADAEAVVAVVGDDARSVEGGVDCGRVVKADGACKLAEPWFLAQNANAPSTAEVDGQPASLEVAYERAAELLRIAPQDCWVIEDSKPGVAAALAAGMRVIAITNTHPAEELQHATHVARTYAEIERLFDQPSSSS